MTRKERRALEHRAGRGDVLAIDQLLKFVAEDGRRPHLPPRAWRHVVKMRAERARLAPLVARCDEVARRAMERPEGFTRRGA